jgi:ATP-dependent DNA helicase RecG
MMSLNLQPTREAETEEYKSSWQDKECLDALVALANTRGGVLWVGIQDNGTPTGWHGDGKEMERIGGTIVAKLQVHPLSMTIESVQGVPVLAIQMAQAVSPVALNGRFFRRVGNSTREIPPEELPRFFLEKTGQSWDDLPSDVAATEIYPEAVSVFRFRAKERIPELDQADTDALLLEKLHLIHSSGRLKRGGVLLFTEKPQKWFPTARIQAARFADDDITMSDEQRFEGSLLRQLEGLLEWLHLRLNVAYEFPSEGEGLDAMQRIERWEIPLVALREAILNALIHRDYTSNASLQVRLYADRVKIINPGRLSEQLTIADLSRPHTSLPRNPLLAEAAYRMGLIENWDTGTLRIIEALREAGLPAPTFENATSGFSISLWYDPLSEAALVQHGLSARQIQAVRLMQQKGPLTNREYREAFSLSDESARRDLNSLVETGIVKREGAGRSVKYHI